MAHSLFATSQFLLFAHSMFLLFTIMDPLKLMSEDPCFKYTSSSLY